VIFFVPFFFFLLLLLFFFYGFGLLGVRVSVRVVFAVFLFFSLSFESGHFLVAN